MEVTACGAKPVPCGVKLVACGVKLVSCGMESIAVDDSPCALRRELVALDSNSVRSECQRFHLQGTEVLGVLTLWLTMRFVCARLPSAT